MDALYKMSSYLLLRQIEGDSAIEIVSNGSKITMWAMVSHLLNKRLIGLVINDGLKTEVSFLKVVNNTLG